MQPHDVPSTFPQESRAAQAIAYVLAAVVLVTAYCVLIAAVRFVLQLPPPNVVRLAGVCGVIAGSVAVWYGLVRFDVPPVVPPRRPAATLVPRRRSGRASEAPSQVGGRGRLEAGGMGRTR
jgi:hypothetical protein